MKVQDLIEVLKTMPQDAYVLHLWDGAPRTAIEHVWLSRDGIVITADCGEHCHSEEDLPVGAVTDGPHRLWYTPTTPMTPRLPKTSHPA